MTGAQEVGRISKATIRMAEIMGVEIIFNPKWNTRAQETDHD